MESPLVELLSTQPSRSAKAQVEIWRSQQAQYTRSSNLLLSLGKKITVALDSLDFTFATLSLLRLSAVKTFRAFRVEVYTAR